MRLSWFSAAATPLLLLGSSLNAAPSESFGTTITAVVPVICKLVHRGEIVKQDEGYSLGQLQQYCNSPTGYVVEIDYQPGTMRGATVRVGDRQILLDGSGHDEVARAFGPKIAVADVSSIPGAAGFDTNALAFRITPLG